MDFGDAVKSGFVRYFDFVGRSSRSEYWWWTLFVFITGLVIGAIEFSLGLGTTSAYGPLSGLLSLLTFIPGLAVLVRRLHDVDRSGWWVLIIFVPLIGFVLLIYWMVIHGTHGPNRFGEDPLMVADA